MMHKLPTFSDSTRHSVEIQYAQHLQCNNEDSQQSVLPTVSTGTYRETNDIQNTEI